MERHRWGISELLAPVILPHRIRQFGTAILGVARMRIVSRIASQQPQRASPVIDYATSPAVLRCTGCNGTAPFPLPMLVSQVTALCDSFRKQHAECVIITEVGVGPAEG